MIQAAHGEFTVGIVAHPTREVGVSVETIKRWAQQHDTRAQVQAQLVEADRTGSILSGDGTLWRDLGTPRQPADTALAGKTRQLVQAELAEANRTGTILSGDGTLWQDLGALHRLRSCVRLRA